MKHILEVFSMQKQNEKKTQGKRVFEILNFLLDWFFNFKSPYLIQYTLKSRVSSLISRRIYI